jgi:hypothetical protein
LPYGAFRVEGKKKSAAECWSAAPVELSRLTVSCRHVADSSLTDKDGKQDIKEDDEKHELHVWRPVV